MPVNKQHGTPCRKDRLKRDLVFLRLRHRIVDRELSVTTIALDVGFSDTPERHGRVAWAVCLLPIGSGAIFL
jgi:hypothetical protein